MNSENPNSGRGFPADGTLPAQRVGPAGRAVLQRLRPYSLFPFLALLAFLMLYPLFMVIYGSFKGGPPGTDAPFTISGYTRTWSDPATIRALFTTFALAVPRIILGMSLAVLFAWIITRTNTPARHLMEQLIWFKVFLPPLPMMLAWVLIFGGKWGLFNHIFGLPLDIRNMAGIIVISALGSAGFGFFFIGPAMRNMDASLEESSRISGASTLTTLRRITAPLLTPAILGAALLFALFILASFETELVLGSSKGIYVFTTYIWHLMGRIPVDYPGAMALSSVFMLIVAGIVVVQFKMWSGRQFVTVTGRGFAVRGTDLGRWKWATFTFVMVYLLFTIAFPLTVLVMGTFQGAWGVFSSGWTLKHWRDTFDDPLIFHSLKNTLMLGLMAATLKVAVYGLMSYFSLRTKLKGRQAIEVLSWVPRAAPGIVMGIGVVWAFLGGIPGIKVLYGTLILMALVITVEGTPTGMRLMNGGMVQIGAELEESARVSGASWFQTVRKVMVPLLAPTVLNVWLLGFLSATRALTLILFLYVPASKVLSIDIYSFWTAGDWANAAVLGLFLTSITMAVGIAAHRVAAWQRRTLEAAL